MMDTLAARVNLGMGWQEALAKEFNKPYMQELARFLAQERQSGHPIYPPAGLVFNAFIQTPLSEVKVVIVGQDPYHGPGQAHGLAFSVPPGVPPPPSLVNIFKELVDDLQIPMPRHGCLVPWARQGVLLLNATLTVRQGEPKSHYGRGWERFTDAALECVLPFKPIFLLWGQSALDKVRHIAPSNPTILSAPHPSPLSAHRGFFKCRHFSAANRYLAQTGRAPIDWSLPDGVTL